MSLHVKVRHTNRPVEEGEVDHRPPTPGDFGSDKEAAVIAWRRRGRFDGPLRAEICYPSSESWEVEWEHRKEEALTKMGPRGSSSGATKWEEEAETPNEREAGADKAEEGAKSGAAGVEEREGAKETGGV